jgi:hypothetical protein
MLTQRDELQCQYSPVSTARPRCRCGASARPLTQICHNNGSAKHFQQEDGLCFDGFSEQDDRLLTGGRRIRHAVCQEEVRRLGNPGAHFLAAERDRLADNVGVELFTLGDDGGQHRSADGATEIAQHVADAGCRRGVYLITKPAGISLTAQLICNIPGRSNRNEDGYGLHCRGVRSDEGLFFAHV